MGGGGFKVNLEIAQTLIQACDCPEVEVEDSDFIEKASSRIRTSCAVHSMMNPSFLDKI